MSSQIKSLSPREREVMRLIALGNTSKEIAEVLKISTKTVDVHRTNLMRKTGLHNAAQVTAYAYKLKLVSI